MRRQTLRSLLFLSSLALCSIASAQTWYAVNTQFPVGIALQLTDGSILIQQFDTSHWWKLTPNNEANYAQGTFTQVASFPASLKYAPLYFASAVLPDGRVIVEGGEFNYGVSPTGSDTTKGAIFDPTVAPNGKWTAVPGPKGWTTIGDASSVVLPDGTFMLANCCALPPQAALLDAKTLTWTVLTSTKGYIGKADGNDEEGWTLLPNGKVLTIDTYWPASDYYNPTGKNSEIYDPSTGTWTSAGNTVEQLWDSRAACGEATSNEIGPAILRPDGTVFATGANSCPGTAGHTAVYNYLTGVWTAGNDIPGGNDIADGPAALVTNGHVLIDTNPGYGNNPSTIYSVNGTGYNTIPQPVGLNPSNTEGARFLLTAEGTILLTHLGSNNMWFFHPAGTYEAAWQPHICAGCYPATGSIGSTYTVSGTQFNGLSQGAAFGDDAQSATNYPLVLITNNATGHKHFARTHSFSTMAVATGNKMVSCKFEILPGTETGDSTMVVIANGIPSDPVGIIIEQ
ncbi:MAG: hypothetical protein ABSG13_23780 [Bryobacteraceae bacterium]|jgi:hypothetical protein